MSAPKKITVADLPAAAWDACDPLASAHVQPSQTGTLVKAREILSSFQDLSDTFVSPEAGFAAATQRGPNRALTIARDTKSFMEHFCGLDQISPQLGRALTLAGIASLNADWTRPVPAEFTGDNGRRLAAETAATQALFLSLAEAPLSAKAQFVVRVLSFINVRAEGLDNRLIPTAVPSEPVKHEELIQHLEAVYTSCSQLHEFELLDILLRFSMEMDKIMDKTSGQIQQAFGEEEAAKRLDQYATLACVVGLEYQSFWPFGTSSS